MIKQYKLRFYNFRLVIFLLAISFIGIQLVGTAADYLRTRQLLGVIIGVVFMLILSLMDYSWLLNFQWIMYGFPTDADLCTAGYEKHHHRNSPVLYSDLHRRT